MHAPRECGWPGHGLCLPHRRGSAGGTAAWSKCTPLALPLWCPELVPRTSSASRAHLAALHLAAPDRPAAPTGGRMCDRSPLGAQSDRLERCLARAQARRLDSRRPPFDPSGGGGHEARRRRAQRAELAPALGAPHGTEAPKCRILPMHVSGAAQGARVARAAVVTHGTMICGRVVRSDGSMVLFWYSEGAF